MRELTVSVCHTWQRHAVASWHGQRTEEWKGQMPTLNFSLPENCFPCPEMQNPMLKTVFLENLRRTKLKFQPPVIFSVENLQYLRENAALCRAYFLTNDAAAAYALRDAELLTD